MASSGFINILHANSTSFPASSRPPGTHGSSSSPLESSLPPSGSSHCNDTESPTFLTAHTSPATRLDRFAKAYIPKWLLDLPTKPVTKVPLPYHAAHFDVNAGRIYAGSLLPLPYMDSLIQETRYGHASLSAEIKQLEATVASWAGLFRDGHGKIELPALPMASAVSYPHRFLPLLQSEYHACRLQLESARLYMTSLTIRPMAGRATVEAKSIREGWPPIDVGDYVSVRLLYPDVCGADDKEHETRVAAIQRVQGLILLECPQLVNYLRTPIPVPSLVVPTQISFEPQENRFEQLRSAVERLSLAMRLPPPPGKAKTVPSTWLFPDEQDSPNLPAPTYRVASLDWKDTALNPEQKQAVSAFVQLPLRIPFLVSGPPGTGKTKTAVEAVLQALASSPDARVLVCGASNPSSDTLASRLSSHLSPDEMFRLQAASRGIEEVRPKLLPYCLIADEHFSFPPLESLLKMRVIVTSCVDASLLEAAFLSNAVTMRYQRYLSQVLHPGESNHRVLPHWTHLVIDEAAQAFEPEVAIPISVVIPDAEGSGDDEEIPKIFICGDVKQLGPRVVSEAARTLDLDVSLLQRLMERKVYAESRGARTNLRKIKFNLKDCTHFVNLTKNYRSHPSILMNPSALFYNDTLEPCADASIQRSSLCTWPRLPHPGFPILFQHVDGAEDWVDEGSSWYNSKERDMVVEVIKDLLATTTAKPHDISVISPFREQVFIIRQMLRALNLGAVDVGNVEALQGAENRVVIISPVRSQHSHRIEEDRRRNRGLIFEAQRFNVAMTRAQELLLVLGNSSTLTVDPNWRSFYHFTRRMHAYIGPDVKGLEDSEYGPGDISVIEELTAEMTLNALRKGKQGRAEHSGMMTVGSVVRSTLRDL